MLFEAQTPTRFLFEPKTPPADIAEETAPLHVACKNNYELCAKMLLEAGALVNPSDKSGYTPLSYAAQDSLKKLLRRVGGL